MLGFKMKNEKGIYTKYTAGTYLVIEWKSACKPWGLAPRRVNHPAIGIQKVEILVKLKAEYLNHIFAQFSKYYPRS